MHVCMNACTYMCMYMYKCLYVCMYAPIDLTVIHSIGIQTTRSNINLPTVIFNLLTIWSLVRISDLVSGKTPQSACAQYIRQVDRGGNTVTTSRRSVRRNLRAIRSSTKIQLHWVSTGKKIYTGTSCTGFHLEFVGIIIALFCHHIFWYFR